ncbi:MAG TPA: type II secretion system protein [Candidatus Saccharimonadales bacterium]
MRQIAKRSRRERGDTIVEVLVAIVIVASVLGGAYVVSNHSLQSTRGTQERASALKLAEAQIEQLKAQATLAPTTIFGAGVPTQFCLTSDATGTHVWDFTVAAQKVNCVVDSNGSPSASTNKATYTLKIVRTGNDFKLTETWVDISGHFSDSLQLNYRAYQG